MYTFGIGSKDQVSEFEFDLYYGVVPRSISGTNNWSILTLKTTYPFFRSECKTLGAEWLRAGVHVNYHLGDEFHFGNFTDKRYPQHYYWWSPAMRVNIFIGSSLVKTIGKNKLLFYYELGTNDLYISSYVSHQNYKVIPFPQILILGFGLKWQFESWPNMINTAD